MRVLDMMLRMIMVMVVPATIFRVALRQVMMMKMKEPLYKEHR